MSPLSSKTLCLILLVLVASSISGCSAYAKFQLEKHRGIWESNKPSHYSYFVGPACLCGPPSSIAHTVVVSPDTVSYEVDTGGMSGEVTNSDLPVDMVLTVDRAFELIEEERKSAVSIKVEYDPEYGYPTYIDINYSRWRTDHRIQYHFNSFKVGEDES